MKAILVIEMPSDCAECQFCGFGGKNLEKYVCCLTGEHSEDSHLVGCPLKPLPEEKNIQNVSINDFYDFGRAVGWNECLDEITGDTDKEKHDADIIRKWERYCDCGTKMEPTATGGWECPVCHRTMKSILFKRITGDKS